MLLSSPQFLMPTYFREETIFPGIPYVDFMGGERISGVTGLVQQEPFKLGQFEDPAGARIRKDAIQKLLDSGRFRFDGDILRMMDYRIENGHVHMDLQPAKYSDQVKSGLSLDLPDRETGVTMRDLLLQDFPGSFQPVSDTRIALTLGSSICLFAPRSSSDRSLVPILVERGKNTAVMNDGSVLLDSASGVFDAPKGKSQIDMEDLKSSIFQECLEEIGIPGSDIRNPMISGFCAEMSRPGKPQFFWVGTLDEDYERLRSRIVHFTRKQDPRVREVSGMPERPVRVEGVCPETIASFAEQNRIGPQAAVSMMLGMQHIGLG